MNDFKILSLEDCSEFIRNGASIKQMNECTAGFPITRIETISNNIFNRDKMGYANITEIDKYRKYILEENDILFSHINGEKQLGRSVIYNKKNNEVIIHGMNLLCIRPKKEIVNPDFLCVQLNSPYVKSYIEKFTKRAVNQASISSSDVKKIPIKIFDLELQNNFVDYVKLLNSLIEKDKKIISLFDELIKSRFNEMFQQNQYEKTYLENLCINKAKYGAQSASVSYEEGRPRYVRITDINDDGSLNDDIVSSKNIEDDETYKLEYGDFLFARMGATVGKTYMYEEGNLIYAGYLIKYKLNTNLINPKYLYFYTKIDTYYDWVKLNQSGSAQPGINAQKYNKLPISVPPIDLQNEFAKFVKLIDKSKFLCEKRIKYYQELLDKKIYEYFN